jgi:hypothetical protein
VGTVLVDLDPGFWLGFGVRVATEVVAAFDHEDPLTELRGRALGDRQSEESGPDDDQVVLTGGGLGR